jgi:hypothetical protein
MAAVEVLAFGSKGVRNATEGGWSWELLNKA